MNSTPENLTDMNPCKRVYSRMTKISSPITPLIDGSYLSSMERQPKLPNEEGSLVVKKESVLDIEDLDCNILPLDISEHLKLLEKMRERKNAPVDTMGCHKLADPLADLKTYRFQVLVALMLSSQTRDEITAAAMERLKFHGCTIAKMIEFPLPELAEILCPVGFYKKKAVYLKKTAVLLKEKFSGDIPDTIDGLCSLPGVGSKMANLALQIAFNRVEGIGVDTHVHRISNRLGWLKTKTPEQTELGLRKVLPRDYWGTVNKLLVGFGQQVCLPVRPKCSECLLKYSCPWPGKLEHPRKK